MSSPTNTFDKVWFTNALDAVGMSQTELARLLGKHKSAVTRMFDGERQMGVDEIGPIARALGVSADEVIAHALGETQSGFSENQQIEFAQETHVSMPPLKRHPLFGSMKGTSIVMPGVDLTEPADPDWGKVYDEDYDHGVVIEPRDGKRT